MAFSVARSFFRGSVSSVLTSPNGDRFARSARTGYSEAMNSSREILFRSLGSALALALLLRVAR
jgi:hypothetical protein